MRERQIDLYHRIQYYLANGGLVNPELMDHNKVRDLLIDCRNSLKISLLAQRYEDVLYLDNNH